MSKAKYVIANGDGIIGVLWENEKLGKVLVTDGKIDANHDLEIYEPMGGKPVKHVDLRDFLLEVLSVEE